VSAPRTVEQARVLGRTLEHDLETMLRRELACAYFCQKIVAVNERDATLIRLTGHSNVAVLGHLKDPAPTPAGWSERSGLLFLGAFHETSSPNYDSLTWFVNEVLPLLEDRLPPGIRFSIAGYVDRKVDMSPFGRNARVDLVGPVEDLAELYGAHRVFIAPTRFAGGIPFKVHEAAAHGIPIVATELLCRQVGWTDNRAILSGGTDDAARFADQVVALYEDETLWNAVRADALRRIETENDRASYLDRLGEILTDVAADAHPRQSLE
jgi:glycosyltransferase involved in cell wall biosynthesis